MNVVSEDAVKLWRLPKQPDNPILPNEIVARKNASDVWSKRCPDGGEKIKQLTRDGPVAVLNPFQQLVENWLDRRIAGLHREASRVVVPFVLWNQWMGGLMAHRFLGSVQGVSVT